jgi:uncharacterized membrane protein
MRWSIVRSADCRSSSGQIVGDYYDATYNAHGLLLDNGSYTRLEVTGSTDTFPTGIDDSGQIVGAYSDATHAFLLENGSYTTVDVPGSTWTLGIGINDSGQIVGYGVVQPHCILARIQLEGIPR